MNLTKTMPAGDAMTQSLVMRYPQTYRVREPSPMMMALDQALAIKDKWERARALNKWLRGSYATSLILPTNTSASLSEH